MDAEVRRRTFEGLARAGYAARGAVCVLAGLCAVVGTAPGGAVRAGPGEARGLPGALEALASAPHGTLAFTAGATGLLVFGAFNLTQARWRRIPSPDPVDAARLARRTVGSAAPRRT
jgi:Domain of Unknown Function (DUF1206)